MPTPEIAQAVLTCMAAAVVIIVIGKIAIGLLAALGRALSALFSAIKGVLITALVGGIVVVIITVALMGTGVVTMPTNQIAPTATAPRPTAVRAVQLDVELQQMSATAAQRYGAGFRFLNEENAVCTLQAYEGQDWLVANCD